MPNNAEVYLIAGVIAGISFALLADVWPGFLANVIFLHLAWTAPIVGLGLTVYWMTRPTSTGGK